MHLPFSSSLESYQIIWVLLLTETSCVVLLIIATVHVRVWRATNAKTIAAALILSTSIMRKNIVYNALCIMHCV